MIRGTIIAGTLRCQDLLPRFLSALEEVFSPAYEQIMMLPFPYIPSDAQYDDGDEWWDSEEAQDKLLHLLDSLNEHAPEGTWFGSHPDDGADFGFWELEGDEG